MSSMSDVGDGIFIGVRCALVVYGREMVAFFEEQAGIFPSYLYDKFGKPWNTSEITIRHTI